MLATALESLTPLGVNGILIVLILREAFGFVSKRRNGTPDTHQLVREVHQIVKKEDGTGVKLVYHPRSLDRAVEDIATGIREQTAALRDVLREQKATCEALAALATQLTDK